MVSWAGRYFGTSFKGYHMVNQEDPLSPTIFNVVLDAVLRHWITVAETKENIVDLGAAETEGFGRDMQKLSAQLYSDGGFQVLTQAACLQSDFDTMKELFNRVGILTNLAKMVSMSCQP